MEQEFSEFRESNKSLKHELDSILRSCLSHVSCWHCVSMLVSNARGSKFEPFYCNDEYFCCWIQWKHLGKTQICTNTCGNWHPHLFCILRYFAFMWCKLSWDSDDQRPNTDPTCLEATVSSFDITFCNEGWLHFMIVKPCTVFCMVWVWTNKLLNGWFNINIGEHCQEVHSLTKADSIRQISVQIGE